MRRPLPRSFLALFAVTVAGILATSARAVQQIPDFRETPFLRIDPEKIILSDRDSRVPCGECHAAEYEIWRATSHSTGFDDMHRTPSGQDILRQMGLRVAKRGGVLCQRCHYTVSPVRDQLKSIAGVSCESCHGPAADWMDAHNDWGEGVDHPDQESAAHEEQRIRQSTEAGMLRPSQDPYAVAANCYECHTVPFEVLVNEGGHVAGTSRFELVDYAGQIRHNFVQLQWSDDDENREPTVERARLMFLTGRMLAYEYGLRGMAEATVEGRYARSMERRVTQAQRDLETVARAVELPAVTEILRVGGDVPLVPDNRAALEAAADSIRTLARSLVGSSDGSELAGLEPLLGGGSPGLAEASGADPSPEDAPPGVAGGDAREEEVDVGGREEPTRGEELAGEDEGGAAEGNDEAAPAPPELPGRIRGRPDWFPRPSEYETLDPGCESCHGVAEDWWFSDPHERAHARLLDQTPRAREIATLYGIGPTVMARGDQICASCHGTVLSGQERVDVSLGVGCESCHGPSSGYLDPHEDGGNPQLGMTALKDPGVRSVNCARCHRVTDERLLASGHPSGEEYDVVAANLATAHYPDERRVQRRRDDRGEGPYPAVGDDALRSAWQQVVASRPVPQVSVATLPPPPQRAVGSGEGGEPPQPLPSDRVQSPGTGEVTSTPPRPAVTRVPRQSSPGAPIVLEPPPSSGEEAGSLEDILLAVKERLERLYRALGGQS